MTGERIGQTIEKWRIDSLIGSGGMGEVYRASRSDGEVNYAAAIKFIRNRSHAVPLHEAIAMRSIQNQHIVRFLQQGVSPDGQSFLVMEYVEGKSITEYADQMGLSIDERLRLFLDVCAAVSAVHQKEWLHLDLKPGNILVNRDAVVKVIDFGNAQRAGFLPEDDHIQPFTGPYASPEQFRNEPPSPAADIYALGAVLYELLSGHPPFDPALPAAELQKRALELVPELPSDATRRTKITRLPSGKYGEVTPEILASFRGGLAPGELRKTIERYLNAVCLFALRKDPHRRYQYVDDIATDLEKVIQGFRPSFAHKGDRVYGGIQAARRKPVVLAVVMFSVSTVVGGWVVPKVMGGARTSATTVGGQANQIADFVTGELERRLSPVLATQPETKNTEAVLNSVLKAAGPVPRTKSDWERLDDQWADLRRLLREIH